MKFQTTHIDGVFVVEPERHRDERGYVAHTTIYALPELHQRAHVGARVRRIYPGPGAWEAGCDMVGRQAVLPNLLGPDGREAPCALVERVHAAGVIIGDVKSGNVIRAPDGPHLVDFDLAWVYRAGSASLRIAQEREMDPFRYTFGYEGSV